MKVIGMLSDDEDLIQWPEIKSMSECWQNDASVPLSADASHVKEAYTFNM